MNADPQKFFVGLIDFFAVWLPGAIAAFLVVGGPEPLRGFGPESWAVFLVASYLAGHVAFHFGAFLDVFYDWLRAHTRRQRIKILAKGKPYYLPSLRWAVGAPFRGIAQWLFGNGDAPLEAVIRIKQERLWKVRASEAVNAFQWTRARLALHNPEALAIVNRFEADSKFFRSLFVVLLAAAALVPFGLFEIPEPLSFAAATLLWLVSLLLIFWRYASLRIKSVNQAHWFALSLEAERVAQAGSGPAPSSGPGDAAAFVLRGREAPTGFLLLGSDDGRDLAVLPKGAIEPGESPSEAAVRQVLEQAGEWARVCTELDDLPVEPGGDLARARIFLMERVGSRWRLPRFARRSWPRPKAFEARPRYWVDLAAKVVQPITVPSEAKLVWTRDGKELELVTPAETIQLLEIVREELKPEPAPRRPSPRSSRRRAPANRRR